MSRLRELPSMRCDPGCGECCGIAPATEAEYRRVMAFVKDRGVKPLAQGLTCPFFQDGTCAVYPVRPLACRLFGHSRDMACPRGYDVYVPERTVRRMIRRNGEADRVLHEALGPGWKELLAEAPPWSPDGGGTA